MQPVDLRAPPAWKEPQHRLSPRPLHGNPGTQVSRTAPCTWGSHSTGLKRLVPTAFITDIKNVKKKQNSFSVLQRLSPSPLPTQLLTHGLRASSRPSLLIAVFTENNQQQCRRWGEGRTVQAEIHRIHTEARGLPRTGLRSSAGEETGQARRRLRAHLLARVTPRESGTRTGGARVAVLREVPMLPCWGGESLEAAQPHSLGQKHSSAEKPQKCHGH